MRLALTVVGYVDAGNPHRAEVMRAMRDLGMEPPPPPFILAPGEYTLYHEWGHYVDHRWSKNNEYTEGNRHRGGTRSRTRRSYP